MALFRCHIFLAALSAACAASAVRIGAFDAACAARAFAARGRILCMSPRAETREHRLVDGASFYSARLDGGGTVFVSSESSSEPIIAFTSENVDFDALPADSTLRVLLERDARVRRASAAAPLRWNRLVAAGALAGATSFGAGVPLASSSSRPEDVRVDALVATRWGQKTDLNGSKCFNLYTPKNYHCGCVATAISQIMRYHRYPDAVHPVAASTIVCSMNGIVTNLTMKGGTYDWSTMPTDASGDRISTAAQRQAIGKLTYDAGVSVQMDYSSGGSSAYGDSAQKALMEVWGYGQSVYLYDYAAYSRGYIDGEKGESQRLAVLRKVLFSNFDAGCPVMIGISGSGGHAVVADGYGFADGVDYVHLNMGWNGTSDLWYNLPDIGTTYDFDKVCEVVYNIFPTNDVNSAVLSGRTVDGLGNGVADATITVRNRRTGRTAATAASSASGVWAAILPAGSYDVCAVSGDLSTTGVVSGVTLRVPNWDDGVGGFEGSHFVTGKQELGNSWGNDVVLHTKRKERSVLWVDAGCGVDDLGRGAENAPFATIQYALTNLNGVVEGDEFRVCPGVYHDCVEAPSVRVSIVATDGPDVTVIDGGGDCCFFHDEGCPDSYLSGFTLRNGGCTYGGGAFGGICSGCVISNCASYYGGGAAYAVLSNCLLTANSAYADIVQVWNMTKYNGGGMGGGAYECELVNCTLASNWSEMYGGGAYLHGCGSAVNTVVANNVCANGFDYGNDVYGNAYWTMVNSISDVDARFRDASGGDYHLRPTSPAVDAGSAAHALSAGDLDGNARVWGAGVDMGCYEYHLPDSSWPDPGIIPSDTEQTIATKTRAAMVAAGFSDDVAQCVTSPAAYATILEWARDNGVPRTAQNASSAALLSPALGVSGLLELSSSDIVINSIVVGSGDWMLGVGVTGYDPAQVNPELLSCALEVLGSPVLDGIFEPLPAIVSPEPSRISATVTIPRSNSFFLKVRMR